MKKIIKLILSIFLILIYNNSYTEEIEYNTEINIKKAVLIENYITRHKEKIEIFINKYDIKNNLDINNDLEIINNSIIALKKIQNTKIKKDFAEKVINIILDNIKIVNDNLKEKLEIERKKYEKRLDEKKKIYSNLWKVLSNKINEINIKVAKNIINNNNLGEIKNEIKNNLIKLNNESLKLKNFWYLDYKSEIEIKKSFISILKNIRKEINIMNKLLNN